MRVFTTCVALGLFVLAHVHAEPADSGDILGVYKVKESILPPRGWTKQARAPPDHVIQLRIALPQGNFEALEQHLFEVSDPFHDRYGQHLSAEEVHQLVAPKSQSITAVNAWLASHGVLQGATRSPALDWVNVKIPVALAEEMLDTEFNVWTREDGETIVRTTSYSLPEEVYEHIELIQPTTLFSTFRGMKSTFHFSESVAADVPPGTPPINVPSASGGKVDANCNRSITISCLLQLYNAVGYKASAKSGNGIAVTGYLEEFANLTDLQIFYADQRPDALNTSFKFVSVNGGLNDQTQFPGMEANLDTQFAFGLAYPIPATFYSTAGRPPFDPDMRFQTNFNEPYLDWLEYVLGHPNPPQAISTSYGDDEQTVPESFAKRVCAGFAQLGARGVSLTFASGDGGVGDGDPDAHTQLCITNDGHNATRFIPAFPATCPYVTAVGGTTQVPEVASSLSGGGFSNYFSRPLYQAIAVQKYLDKLPHGTYAGLFNPTGRAIPDVAAQAGAFRMFLGGRTTSADGTSASSPTFAAIIALLNDARIKKHLPPLGFLNPLIYTIDTLWPQGFNDITSGNNPGCGTNGFNATKGWDPITGVGTPNFGKLKDIVTLHL